MKRRITDDTLVRKLLSEKLEVFDKKGVFEKALAKAMRSKRPRHKVHHKPFYEK